MNRDRCSVEDEALWDLVDHPADPDAAELRAHAELCPRCTRRLEELRRLHATLESVCRVEPKLTPAFMGPYRIVRRIGEGGMGIVYEAEQDQPRRRVAVKVMRRSVGGGAQAVRLFRREIQALGRLRHPGLVTIHDAGEHEGELYMVMEHVDGTPLDRHCAQRDLSLQERVELCIRVAEAVHHAHERGVLHLDLKPANVLVEADGAPRVLDFGLARFVRATGEAEVSQTLLASPLGTLPYMSPEQLRGARELDAGADVYSIGAVLYELLTGQPPYGVSRSLADALIRLETPPRSPAAVARVPRSLSCVVMKAIAAQKEDRYHTVAALADDLERWRDGEDVLARPPNLQRRWWRRVQRHPRSSAATASAVCATVAFSLLVHGPPVEPPMQRTVLDVPELVFSADTMRAFDAHREGQRIAYLAAGELRIWDRRKSEHEVVASQPEGEHWAAPRWSPSGASIAVFVRVARGRWALDRIDLSSRVPARVAEGIEGRPRGLCWSADGRQLLHAGADRVTAVGSVLGDPRWSRSVPGSITSLGGASPDGRWVLLEMRQKGESGAWLLPVPEVGGEGPRIRMADTGTQPCWSFDGAHVYSVRSDEETGGSDNLYRHAFDSAAGQVVGLPRRLTNGADASVRHPIGLRTGVLYGLERSTRTVVTAAGDAFEDATPLIRGRQPALTPDGSTVLFLGGVPGEDGLFAMPRTGGVPWRLAPDVHGGWAFASPYEVSPDGGRVAYAAPVDGRYEIRVVALGGGGARTLAITERAAVPRWSASGRELAFLDGGALCLVAADGRTAPRRLTPDDRWHDFAWSPRADLLAALRGGSSESVNQLYLIDAASGVQVCITPGEDGTYKEGLAWHPSGEFCAYVGGANTDDDVEVRLAFTDGRPSALAIRQEGHWDYVGVWAPDGRRFFFQSYPDPGCDEGEPNALHVFDLHERRVVQHGVPGSGGALPRWSTDGSALVWTRGRAMQSIEILADR